MRLFKRWVLVYLLAGQCGLVWAGEAVRVFASELMLHESRQVLQPDRPLKYSDPEGGAALRALLAPARTKIVMDDYFSGFEKTGQPDIPKLIGPLVKRYEKAFVADPRAYEEEYLDVLNWLVTPIEGAARVSSANMQKNAAVSGPDAEAAQKLLESLQSLSDNMMKLVAQSIRDRANSGVYSAAGKARALSMADRVTATLRPASPGQVRAEQQAPVTSVRAQDIEERFSRQSLLSSDALEQLLRCNADVPRNRYEELINNTKKGQTVAGFLGHSGAKKLVGIADQYWTCVSFSPTGYAILPVEVLRNTVVTVGATRAGLVNWRRQLLAELAMNGKAQGLIELRDGNAYAASYTLTRDTGATLSYDTTLLKRGTYNRADYKPVISESPITNVMTVHIGESKTKSSTQLLAPLARAPLTSDGYIPIVGTVATANTDFTGSIWKFESVSGPGNILRLNPGGVAIYEMPQKSETGEWKIAGNVLQVRLNSEVRYSLALTEDGRFLQGELRRQELPRPVNIPGIPVIPQHDDFDPELRFKIPRLYRESDTEHEEVMAGKREEAKRNSGLAVQKLLARAEERKMKILAETPEQEAAEQALATTRSGKPEYTWRVCDGALQSDLMMAKFTSPTAAADFAGKTVGEICYAWLGTRKNWKATILQQGCNNRCEMH